MHCEIKMPFIEFISKYRFHSAGLLLLRIVGENRQDDPLISFT